MNTNCFLRKEVFEIVGCAMEVLNEIGYGFMEKPEFQKAKTRMGKNRVLKLVSIRVHSWFKKESCGDEFLKRTVFDPPSPLAATAWRVTVSRLCWRGGRISG